MASKQKRRRIHKPTMAEFPIPTTKVHKSKKKKSRQQEKIDLKKELNPHMTDSMKGIISDALNLNKEYDYGKQYCGSFQYTTSRDRSWIHADGTTEWAGVLYLTPDAPPSSGTGFFKFKEGGYTRYTDDKEMNKYIDTCSQDFTKWEKITEVANVYNRLILYDARQFHMSLDYCKSHLYI